jgi:outer membrane protein
VNTLFSPVRTACVAAAAILLAASGAAAQQLSEARIAELIAQAKAQAASQAPTQASTPQSDRPTINLTLDEALKSALEQNLDISVERLNPQTWDIALAQLRASYAPTVGGTAGNRYTVQLPRDLLAGGAQVQNSTFTFNGNLSKPMPWYGGTAALTFNNNRAVNNGSSLNTFNPSYQTTFTLGYTQPLLRNFKIDSTRQSLQTTQISRELADVNLKAVITSTLASVKDAYWDYVYTVQAVDVARQSLQLAEKLVEDNQTKVEIGTMAPLDVVTAQSEAATRRQTLAQAEGALRTAELALKRLIVSGTQDRLWSATLNPVDRADFKPEPIDVDAAVRVALEQRTDLIQARRNLESSEISLKYLGNQKLPQLDLVASYGLQGIGGNQLLRTVDPNNPVGGLVTTTIPGGYLDALHILRQANYPSWNVQMTFSYPIGTSTADAQVASAKVRLTQSQAQLRASELSVATEVTNAGLTVQTNLKRVEAAMVARDLAQQRLDAEQAKFEVGMSTNFLVVQAQRDLRDAQNVELRAVLDYRKSLVDFERAQFTRAGVSGSAAAGTGSSSSSSPTTSSSTGSSTSSSSSRTTGG